MSAPMLRPTGQAAAEMELLAQLGLPASASPEDVDQLHQSVSDFLSSAPPEIRGWARAQVAALDAAYITLTDPAGLEGSALMSPASPPVALEEPATPPAPRGPDSEATSVASEEAVPADADVVSGESEIEDLAALYAMVTPSAHDDMKPGAKQPKPSYGPTGGAAGGRRDSTRRPQHLEADRAGWRGGHRHRGGGYRRQRDREPCVVERNPCCKPGCCGHQRRPGHR